VDRRFRRWIDLGTHIAARNRIDLAVEQAPFLQRDDIDFVERAKALLGERSRRAQFARTKRRQRPARLGDQPLDPLKPLLERHRGAESHALDAMPRYRRNTGGKLKYARQEAEAARGKIDCIGHIVSPKRQGARQLLLQPSRRALAAASLPAAAAADQELSAWPQKTCV